MKIGAIVVTYYPKSPVLSNLLAEISHSVDYIYVVDNTPVENVKWLTSTYVADCSSKAQYTGLGDNLGIATAQNKGIELASNDSCDYVIFFDQDSAPPRGMVNKLLNADCELRKSGIKVGSVGPLFLDQKTNEYGAAIQHKGIFVKKISPNHESKLPITADYIISSGSLMKLSVLSEVGLMRDELFIDWVDIEWGLRASSFGYEHFIIPDAIMLHSIGDKYVRLGRRNINLHNDIRNFYIVRNACFLITDRRIPFQWRASMLFKVPAYVVFFAIFSLSQSRSRAFVLLIQACFKGFAGKLGKAF